MARTCSKSQRAVKGQEGGNGLTERLQTLSLLDEGAQPPPPQGSVGVGRQGRFPTLPI